MSQIVYSLRPDIVASLTLASTWTFYGEEGAAGRIAYVRERLATKSMVEGSIGDAPYLLAPGVSSDIAARVAAVEGAKDPEPFLRSWLSMFPVDLRPVARKITVPVLLIAAEHDPITPRRTSRSSLYTHMSPLAGSLVVWLSLLCVHRCR